MGKVEFSEGEEFTVIIHEAPKKPKRKGFRDALKTTAGEWKDLIDDDELKRNICNDLKEQKWCSYAIT